MEISPVFAAAFWAGLASPASLYAGHPPYRPIINNLTFAEPFVLVGVILTEAMATSQNDGSAAASTSESQYTFNFA
jgi:hypothetical protein